MAARLHVRHTSPHVANCSASCSTVHRLHVRRAVLNLARISSAVIVFSVRVIVAVPCADTMHVVQSSAIATLSGVSPHYLLVEIPFTPATMWTLWRTYVLCGQLGQHPATRTFAPTSAVRRVFVSRETHAVVFSHVTFSALAQDLRYISHTPTRTSGLRDYR